MRREHLIGICIFALTLLCAGAAAAQTPDGETPANEGVCDELQDATPGLYGLCVAFCEATDCDPDFSAPNPFAGCRPSAPQLLRNYNRRKKPSDPDMPCVKDPCPCWSAEELAGLRFQDPATDSPPWPAGFTGCVKDFTGVNPFIGPVINGDFWIITDLDVDDPSALTGLTVLATAEDIDGSGPVCVFIDACFEDGDCSQTQRFQVVTLEELAACEVGLAASGAARDFDCF